MYKRLFAILQYFIFLGAGIFLVWWSINKLSDKDYSEFINSLKNANYYLLIPVFFILIASHLSRAIRWKILMESMNYKPKLSNAFCAVMVGYPVE
jgi:glycosyltransferase 2 family protein